MCIAIVIPDTWEPSQLIQWSATLARAKEKDLLIVRSKRLVGPQDRKKTPLDVETDASPLAAGIREHAPDFEVMDLGAQEDEKAAVKKIRSSKDRDPFIFLKEYGYAELVEGVLREIKALRVALLIVPRKPGVRISEEDFAAERQLFLEVPCETMQLRPGRKCGENSGLVLVATDGSRSASPALDIGAALAASEEKPVTALYVEQTGAPLPRSIRRKDGEQLVFKSLKSYAEYVTQDKIVDEDVPRGVCSYAEANGHDLVIVGAGGHLSEKRRVTASVPEKLMAGMEDPTIVVVRKAMPLTGRLMKSIEHRKKALVPQLDREARIELVERLQSCAKWDFDFMFLICLATLLAALGLMVNSTPVVIGAMLVAPLMTPMLGLGLSVVQGNRQMAHGCSVTIAKGFLLAFLTGCAAGTLRVLFTSGITEEMSSRGAPGILDLAVAFVSGVVAAYAFGRPHLLSVIPGIAIATSLVPPLATAGLALLVMNLYVALGATLLFFSNFVAIVLGCALSLWVVGMRGPREICPFSAWAQRWMFGFLAAAVCLGVFLSVRREDSEALAAPIANAAAPLAEAPAAGDAGAATQPEQPQVSEQPQASEQPRAPEQPRGQETITVQAEGPVTIEQGNGEIHIVLKPPVTPGSSASGADVTVVLPGEASSADQANTAQVPPESEVTRRKLPWKQIKERLPIFSLRLLRERRNATPPPKKNTKG